MKRDYAAITKRMLDLERVLDNGHAQDWGNGGAAENLRYKFLQAFCRAIGHVRREGVDNHPWVFTVERLRVESPVTVASYVAALRYLGHPDEYEAADTLDNSMCSERGIDPAPLRTLISLAVRLASEASARADL